MSRQVEPEAVAAKLGGLLGKEASEMVMTAGERPIKQGEARGRAEGRADAVLTVLAARGIGVPEQIRARLLGCGDLAELDRWLARAATCSSAEELLGAG
ncbi:MAG: hypothetical protein HY744_22870 [Deltaproteobacteria bacterium]|nr:hypothetical protein [Deltaproteobacteria bacterium]